MSLYTEVQKNITVCYTKFKQQSSQKYAQEVIIGFGIFAGLVVGYVGYGMHTKKREQQAFGALVEVIDSFEKAEREKQYDKQKEEQSQNVWQDTELLIDALYKQNENSYLAPYFLIFKSQVMLEQGASVDEALKILETGLEKISNKSPFYDMYNLKRVLMSFDSADEQVRKNALQDLIVITQDEKGYSFEEASYMLGLYYMSQGNIEGARDLFERLLKFSDKKALLQSAWIKLAEEKLESIKHV